MITMYKKRNERNRIEGIYREVLKDLGERAYRVWEKSKVGVYIHITYCSVMMGLCMRNALYGVAEFIRKYKEMKD